QEKASGRDYGARVRVARGAAEGDPEGPGSRGSERERGVSCRQGPAGLRQRAPRPVEEAAERDSDDRLLQDSAGEGRAGLHGGGAGHQAGRRDYLSTGDQRRGRAGERQDLDHLADRAGAPGQGSRGYGESSEPRRGQGTGDPETDDDSRRRRVTYDVYAPD